MGAFILKDEVVDTITSGSFFAKQKEKTEGASSQAKSTAVELREASKNPVDMVTISSVKMNSKPENTERKKESETVSMMTYISYGWPFMFRLAIYLGWANIGFGQHDCLQ